VPRLQYWIGNGAKVSDRVKSLINKLAPEVTKEMTSRKVAKVEKKRVKRKATKK
jgi:ribosomal protein S16